jgi:hypothetical protein
MATASLRKQLGTSPREGASSISNARCWARLKALSSDTREAETLLAQFESTLAIFEADLKAIQDDEHST